MTTLIITRGIPASGKTTWAKGWVLQDPGKRARASRDDLREMLFAESGLLSHDKEKVVTDVQRETVKGLLRAGISVVVDNTNLRARYVREWRKLAALNGADPFLSDFPIAVDEAVRRDAGRACMGGRYVGEDVIRMLAGKFTRNGELLPVPEEDVTLAPEQYVPDGSKPRAIMVDIDGTLAIMDGRSPYDLSLVATDKPNWPVIEAVQSARRDRLEVLFCSGRSEEARDATNDWLDDLGFRDERLLMRTVGDMRKDAIVKRELFDKHIRNHFNVRYVLDDRQQVVDMWRELGLTVFQVAPGDF